jgi:SAM-dependent methyltransferase
VRPALPVLDWALHRAARGDATPIDLLSASGTTVARMDAAEWYVPRAGDDALLDACTGGTLDVGCGPGRLVLALRRRRVTALGVDISAVAIDQARRSGADAIVCDVFGPVPDEGRWRHVLLADGNIGIGGDPVRLLRRCLALATPEATIVVETGRPGSGTWRKRVRLRDGSADSLPFWWAAVDAGDLAVIAARAGARVVASWTEHDRWFACLAPANDDLNRTGRPHE